MAGSHILIPKQEYYCPVGMGRFAITVMEFNVDKD
jgi:hypothetical protein